MAPLDGGNEEMYSHAQLSIKQRVGLLLAGHAPDGPVKHCVRCHLAEGGKPEHQASPSSLGGALQVGQSLGACRHRQHTQAVCPIAARVSAASHVLQIGGNTLCPAAVAHRGAIGLDEKVGAPIARAQTKVAVGDNGDPV